MNLPGRIVVLGGYGEFGARVSRALARQGRGEICIAGRRPDRARRLATELERDYPGSRVRAIELDRENPRFVRSLGRIAPIVVIHAAGPFQGQDYTVAEACLACRSHYLDFADARRFVADFAQLDREAARRDVLLVTGASTLPGVSSAVVNALAKGLDSIESIETSIVPANRSVRGVAALEAVLSYCGKRVPTLEHGRWIDRIGWRDGRTIKYPGFERRVTVCDVPDLELFPERYVGVETVTFHAGPEFAWHRIALACMASLARMGLVRDWSRYARAAYYIDTLTVGWGTATGAMQVRVSGRSNSGAHVARTWHLVADDNDGHAVPCVPSTVLAEKLVTGSLTERGAKACVGLIDLADVARSLAGSNVRTEITEECLAG